MKFKYGFEYTEKDYATLHSTTSLFLEHASGILSKILDSHLELEKMKENHRHEIKRSELKTEKDELEQQLEHLDEKIEQQLEHLDEKISDQERDIARLKRRNRKEEDDNVVNIYDEEE